MTIYELIESLAESHGGRFFRISFVKRTTGEPRTIVGRMGVVKHLAGGGPAYDFKDKGLLPVWITDKSRRKDDVGSKTGYRAIPIEGITELQSHGRRWVVNGEDVHEVGA